MSIQVHVCPGRNQRAARFIAGLLDEQPDFEVTRCPQCQGEASPGIVVMVTGLANQDELARIAATRQAHPLAQMIVLSLCNEALFETAVLRLKVQVFMRLDEAVPELFETIRLLAERRAPGRAGPPVVTRHSVAS